MTGSSGFIGTSLAESLSRDKDYDVGGFDMVEPRECFDKVAYFYGNLLDVWSSLPDLFREFPPDAIVHCAAQARVDPSLSDPFGTYDANTVGTLNLLKYASLQKPPPLFVYLSSEAIYGQADHYPTKETDHFRPINPYAASKIAADVMVQQLNDRLGMRTCVLRSGMGMGPRSPPHAQVVSRFIVNMLNGKPLKFPGRTESSGEPSRLGPRITFTGWPAKVSHPTRDVNPVWNFVDGVRLVLEAKARGVFNIASGREISILKIAQRVLEFEWPISHGGYIDFDPAFSYRQGEEGMRTWLDISKARKELGYEPELTFEDALPPTIEWFKKWKDVYWAKA